MKGMDLHLATRVQGYPYLWLAWSQYEVLLHNTQTENLPRRSRAVSRFQAKGSSALTWNRLTAPGSLRMTENIRVMKKLDDHEKDLRKKIANGSTSSIKTTVNSEVHDNSTCTWRVLSKVQFLVLLKLGWWETIALENFLIILIAMITIMITIKVKIVMIIIIIMII